MTKWNTTSEAEWLDRVRKEAKVISLKTANGQLSGPEVQEAIVALFRKAVERMPDEAITNAIGRGCDVTLDR